MRLRFTIRDLLWLLALVAVSVAWWIDHREIVGQRNDAVRTAEGWQYAAGQLPSQIEEAAKQNKSQVNSD
jgi:hypothetical protein